jgi:hypothetical protein
MGWKPEVKTVNDAKWYQNGLVFATEAEATNSAFNLMMKWSAVEDYRAVEVDEPVNYEMVDGVAKHVEGAA